LLLAADARLEHKSKRPIISLARGTVTIRKHRVQKITLQLTSAGRRFIASHHGRVNATATIATTIRGHTTVVKNRLTLRIAKPPKTAGAAELLAPIQLTGAPATDDLRASAADPRGVLRL
jgi:hypothetical protein